MGRNMKRIWVTGEALIDFIPGEIAGGQAFVPCCGGSTFNAAKAAALQGAPVSFIGAISTDMFGEQLAADLSAYGVDVSMAPRSDDPSTLAFVSYEGPEPRYAFFNRQSATQMTDMSQLSCEIRPGDILHLGSISLVENPGADSIAKFALARDPNVLVSFDPNVRESIISDREDWLRRFEMLLARSALLKLSDDDLQYIAPDVSPKAFARTCLDVGAALVVVTLGQDGMIAETREGSVHVPANRNPGWRYRWRRGHRYGRAYGRTRPESVHVARCIVFSEGRKFEGPGRARRSGCLAQLPERRLPSARPDGRQCVSRGRLERSVKAERFRRKFSFKAKSWLSLAAITQRVQQIADRRIGPLFGIVSFGSCERRRYHPA